MTPQAGQTPAAKHGRTTMTDTDTSAEAVDRLVELLANSTEQQTTQPPEMVGLSLDDEYTIIETLRALLADRDAYKARVDAYEEMAAEINKPGVLHNRLRERRLKIRAERAERALSGVAANSTDKKARFIATEALAQIDAEPVDPGLTLADAYRAGLEAAANRVEVLPEKGNAGVPQDNVDRLLDAQRRSDADAIRALKVPTEFGGE